MINLQVKMENLEDALIQLKNGSKEYQSYVDKIYEILKDLYATKGIVFYNLCKLCEDENYKTFGTTKDVLKQKMLLESNGLPSSAVKNIVLSAIDEKYKLVHPIAT